MILVDVEVPVMGKTYDVQIDETVPGKRDCRADKRYDLSAGTMWNLGRAGKSDFMGCSKAAMSDGRTYNKRI